MSRFERVARFCRQIYVSQGSVSTNCCYSRASVFGTPDKIPARFLHSTCPLAKTDDRKAMMASLPKKDEGTQGHRSVDIDSVHVTGSLFPDIDTPNMLFDGVRFADLPICHVRCSMNNTIIQITDAKGAPLSLMKSGGTEGYKNARKGTTVAAQAAAMSISSAARSRSIDTVRVVVRGLGPGRLASVQGLQMGGLNIVSITDRTFAPHKLYQRPRKAKRL
ncbi:small ribosomal subunit protein uS11m-like [Ornithodoros turicata]|uniref:small ribosomal subunit protein uS11m-like n=1 Tax=Ornithodoros turicata TaxID=34597 RepID=UPI003138E168